MSLKHYDYDQQLKLQQKQSINSSHQKIHLVTTHSLTSTNIVIPCSQQSLKNPIPSASSPFSNNISNFNSFCQQKMQPCQSDIPLPNQQSYNPSPESQSFHQPQPYFQIPLSKTQKNILSHQLINSIVKKSKQKTVVHNIGKISKQSRLYRLVNIDNDKTQAIADGQLEEGAKRFRKLFEKLGGGQQLAQRIKHAINQQVQKQNQKQKINQRYNKFFFKRNRRSSQKKINSQDNISKRVSVSGLVSYNFTSVKCRRSLAVIPSQPQSITIQKKILERNKLSQPCSHSHKFSQSNLTNPSISASLSQASICNFHTPTQKFLSLLHKESQNQKLIYGNRFDNLQCIKSYMKQEKVEYAEAKFVVERIVQKGKNGKGNLNGMSKGSKGHGKNKFNDDIQLQKRMKVLTKKKIILKQLSFVE